MKKNTACIFLYFFFLLGSAFSEDIGASGNIIKRLETVLQPSVVNKLVKESSVRKILYGEKNMDLSICPATNIAKMTTDGWKKNKPVFMVESLYLYKKTNPQNSKDISKILHSVSKLEGIEYYSTSRKKMRTLYEKSYAVKPVKDEKNKVIYHKINDQLTAESMLVLQKDLTFGEYIYSYNYKKTDDGVGFFCENTEKLKYSFFKIVDPYEMNIALSVTDFGDYLLVYVNTRANFAKLGSLKKKLENSFSTRADAIYNWFISEYESY
ncbi:MAG: hypothetical protein CR988_02665 [Treponema sp.]|nr:MAG: hypothetical protein CR988_02665 [Treponema sp.]